MSKWQKISSLQKRTLWGLGLLAALFIALLLGLLSKDSEPVSNEENHLVRLNSFISNEQSYHSQLDKEVTKFMKRWELHGAQLAVMRGDSLLYAKGYGEADVDTEMQPYMTLRVASVSKLVTAAAIMVLCEQGRLSLSDKVLGEQGIIKDSSLMAVIRDKRHYEITVEHLLRHQAGFSTRLGDPMFRAIDFAAMNRLQQPPSDWEMCHIVLSRRLSARPGTHHSYSNFGYLLLSLLIERVSGLPYADFVRHYVLEPAGCYDFHIAGNFYEEKKPSEVRYFMHGNSDEVSCYDLSGRMVERCYGGNNVTALSGAGAWCCSAPELMRFVASIDGNPAVPDIISPESVARMVQYFDKDTYSLGWNDTHPEKGWTRSGSFSGTAALIQYFPDGDCWVFITNTSTYKGHNFSRRVSRFFRSCRQKYLSGLNPQNLFIPDGV